MAKKKSGGGAVSPNAGTGGEDIVRLDPAIIYFTFSRIRPCFSCGRTIESTLLQFQRGELKPTDLPLLSVFSSSGAASVAAASSPRGDTKRGTAGAESDRAPTKGKRGNKKGHRRGAESSDSGEDSDCEGAGGRPGGSKKGVPRAGQGSEVPTTYYFSQNNRRLYMYKQLRDMGYLETIPVRLKPLPQTRRMAQKYAPEKCSLTATLQREGGTAADRGGSASSQGSDGDDRSEVGEVEMAKTN